MKQASKQASSSGWDVETQSQVQPSRRLRNTCRVTLGSGWCRWILRRAIWRVINLSHSQSSVSNRTSIFSPRTGPQSTPALPTQLSTSNEHLSPTFPPRSIHSNPRLHCGRVTSATLIPSARPSLTARRPPSPTPSSSFDQTSPPSKKVRLERDAAVSPPLTPRAESEPISAPDQDPVGKTVTTPTKGSEPRAEGTRNMSTTMSSDEEEFFDDEYDDGFEQDDSMDGSECERVESESSGVRSGECCAVRDGVGVDVDEGLIGQTTRCRNRTSSM